MDNMCTIYDVNNRDASGAAKIVRELAGYEGFLSSCRFLDDTHIITGSGDMKICVWDLEAGKKTSEMDGHNGDVVSISLSPDKQTYVTGSVDKTCKLWDLRETTPKQTFFGHTADVNSVFVNFIFTHITTTFRSKLFLTFAILKFQFHPSGQAFATASEDKSARLFDIRSDQQIANYEPTNPNSGFTSCGMLFSLYCNRIEKLNFKNSFFYGIQHCRLAEDTYFVDQMIIAFIHGIH